MIILETPRLILRDFELNDLDKIYDLVYADPQVKNTWSTVTGTPEAIKDRFARLYIRPESRFGLKALLIRETSDLIGLMGFQIHEPAQGEAIDYLLTEQIPYRAVNFDPQCLEVELTYALGRPFWKQGFATEMGQALIGYGFRSLGIGRIIQGVLAQNRNSINLMRRLGFHIERGLHPESVVGILEKAEWVSPSDSLHVFSSKAEKYARYRWDYAPEAIQAVFTSTRVGPGSSVADIGAGTGILTVHFPGKVGHVYAVEPNAEMREIALRALAGSPECTVLDGRAEAVPLPDGCVDLILVGQAFNWFDPNPARREFARILKPGGWLASLRNYGTDHELGAAVQAIYPAETDTQAIMKGAGIPPGFYFGGEYFRQTYPFTIQQTFEQFLGGLSSASYAPDEDSPLYAEFAGQARQVFERFAENGRLASHGLTELCLGHIKTQEDPK